MTAARTGNRRPWARGSPRHAASGPGSRPGAPGHRKGRQRCSSTTRSVRAGPRRRSTRSGASLQARYDELTAEYEQTVLQSQVLRLVEVGDTAGDDQADSGTKTAERDTAQSLLRTILDRRAQFEHALDSARRGHLRLLRGLLGGDPGGAAGDLPLRHHLRDLQADPGAAGGLSAPAVAASVRTRWTPPMGDILVGTASWTDRTLLDSGWYPQTADTPEKRLAYYARQFPLVEVDATYYAPPAERDRAAVGRAHPGRLHLQHQGVQPADRAPDQGLARCTRTCGRRPRRATSTRTTCPRRRTRRSGRGSCPRWTRWSRPASWACCCSSSRRGSPSGGPTSSTCWRWPSAARRCARCYRVPPRVLVRRGQPPTRRWTSCASTSCRTSAWTCRRATARRSRRCWPPPRTWPWSASTATATSGPARTSTRSSATDYSERELQDWAPKLRALADEAEQTHVLMNNCYRDYAQPNAKTLAGLLDAD